MSLVIVMKWHTISLASISILLCVLDKTSNLVVLYDDDNDDDDDDDNDDDDDDSDDDNDSDNDGRLWWQRLV